MHPATVCCRHEVDVRRRAGDVDVALAGDEASPAGVRRTTVRGGLDRGGRATPSCLHADLTVALVAGRKLQLDDRRDGTLPAAGVDLVAAGIERLGGRTRLRCDEP